MSPRRDILYGRRAPLMALLCVVAVATAIGSVGACRRGVPVLDPGARPPTTDGTISGTVRGPEGTSSVANREVSLIAGESILKQPGIMNINRSDVDAHADFIIGSSKSLRSRRPSGGHAD